MDDVARQCKVRLTELLGSRCVQDLENNLPALDKCKKVSNECERRMGRTNINLYLFTVGVFDGGVVAFYPYVLHELSCRDHVSLLLHLSMKQ